MWTPGVGGACILRATAVFPVRTCSWCHPVGSIRIISAKTQASARGSTRGDEAVSSRAGPGRGEGGDTGLRGDVPVSVPAELLLRRNRGIEKPFRGTEPQEGGGRGRARDRRPERAAQPAPRGALLCELRLF